MRKELVFASFLVLTIVAVVAFAATFDGAKERKPDDRLLALQIATAFSEAIGEEHVRMIVAFEETEDGAVRSISQPIMPGDTVLGACDDEDDCEENAQDGCDNGCPGSGLGESGQACGDGDVTDVEVNGSSCFARCANGKNVYIELCPTQPQQSTDV